MVVTLRKRSGVEESRGFADGCLPDSLTVARDDKKFDILWLDR